MPTADDRSWAVILGVSSGTGASIAREVARRSHLDVFGMHRGHHQEAADTLAAEIAAGGRRAELMVSDAALPDNVESGALALAELVGPRKVRLFVHSLADASIGYFVDGPNAPFHPGQFNKTFQTMAHSFVQWAQKLVEHDLLQPGAMLLALTNPFVDALCGGFGMVAAAKAALETYVRYLAAELGPLGYRVNALRFGLVETPAVRRAFSDEAWNEIVRRLSVVTPGRRIATTDEVARFVTHLIDEDAVWLNGTTIDFSGGQTQATLSYLFYHP